MCVRIKCIAQCKRNILLEPSREDHTDFQMQKTSEYSKGKHAISNSTVLMLHA